MKSTIYIFTILVLTFSSNNGISQAIYEESKVPAYELPNLLKSENGQKITSSSEWLSVRRPEILALFENEIYGRIPGELKISSYKILEKSSNALNGEARRKQVLLNFKNNGKELNVNLLIYLPKNAKKAPLFVGYNFYGNHTIADDPSIIMSGAWSRNNEELDVNEHRTTEKSRGKGAGRWDLEAILKAGYGLATMWYNEIDPDKYGESDIDFSDGIHPLLYKDGQTHPGSDEWGAISAWAWGLSRAMDYFEQDNDIDQTKIVVMGHSRLGKTSLWAGALDQRFAIVISNNSGCGGAALSRRRYGERMGGMNQYFGHWFCDNLSKYDGNEDTLPVDQHMLIALIAPRPVYIASAEDDKWADPKGEYLSGYYATPVYELLGKQGLPTDKMPEVNEPVMTTIGYHIRTGGHGVTDFDWEQYIKFADKHFKTK